MNSQFPIALGILGGAGFATLALFLIIHNSFRSALMPKKASSNSSDETGRYFGRIY